MSQKFESKTTVINLSGVEGSGSEYREVTTVTGEEGNYTFSTVIQVDRKKDKKWEEIGTKNQSGVITLNKNASSNEKKYLNTTLKDQLKANSEDLVNKVSAGLTLKPTELIKLKEGLNLPVSTADLVDAVNEGTDLINSIPIKGRNFRKEYAHYSYPEGLKSNKQDRIRFEQVYSEGTKITTAS